MFKALSSDLLLYQISPFLPSDSLLNLVLTNKQVLLALQNSPLQLAKAGFINKERYSVNLVPDWTVVRLRCHKLAIKDLILLNGRLDGSFDVYFHALSKSDQEIKAKPIDCGSYLRFTFQQGRLLQVDDLQPRFPDIIFSQTNYQLNKYFRICPLSTELNCLRDYQPAGLWLDCNRLVYCQGDKAYLLATKVTYWTGGATREDGFSLRPLISYSLQLLSGQTIDYEANRDSPLWLDGQPVSVPLSLDNLIFSQTGVELMEGQLPDLTTAPSRGLPWLEDQQALKDLQTVFNLKLEPKLAAALARYK